MPPRPPSSSPSPPISPPLSSLKTTGKMPRCELDLLRREARGETFEDGIPPSSLVLPLVTRKRENGDRERGATPHRAEV